MSTADVAETQEQDAVVEETDEPKGDGKYERSSIAFPYGPLRDAEEIVRSLHSKWGMSADVDQLAAGMDTTKSSGTFRSKMSTARTFGVIEGTRGSVRLTPLGAALVDSKRAPSARVDAFLRVPLFNSLYEAYKGVPLPSDDALENEILKLGVSSKQTDRARQSFQRSAEQAGFFQHGRDRLVKPNVEKLSDPEAKLEDRSQEQTGNTPKMRSSLRPEVADLMATLLNDGSSWSSEKVAEFLATARKLNELLSSK